MCVSIPLVCGKVPPNAIYGIRTKFAFSSEENWYAINKFGGKVFVGVAVVIMLVGITGIFLPDSSMNIYGPVAAGICIVSVLGAAAIITIESARAKK